MPKIDISKLPSSVGSGYPAPYNTQFGGRSQIRLSQPGGLTQFGANLVRLAPGAMSSLRHWHEKQDEFLVITEGVLVLVEDGSETLMAPGDVAAFPAGAPNGHHLVNKSDTDAAFIVVGTHTPTETGWYSDIDMKVEVQNGQFTFTRKDGSQIDETLHAFEEIGKKLTDGLVHQNFDSYRAAFQLPARIIPRQGAAYTLNTQTELEADFDLYARSMKLHHVTDMFREVLSVTDLEDGQKAVLARVHLLSNANQIVDPFQTTFVLAPTDAGWRVIRIESSLGHINWTRGIAGITPDQKFESD